MHSFLRLLQWCDTLLWALASSAARLYISLCAIILLPLIISLNEYYSLLKSSHLTRGLPTVLSWNFPIKYRHPPHNDVSVNDGPHIRQW